MHPLQVAAMLRARRVADPGGGLVVRRPDPLSRLDGGVQRDVRIAMLARPDDRFAAEYARDPDAWVGLLERERPRIDDPVLIVGALPPKRPGLGPDLDD